MTGPNAQREPTAVPPGNDTEATISGPCAGAPAVDLGPVEEILARYPHAETSLIQVLQDVNRTYNYLPCHALERVAAVLQVPLARVFSVATFYKAFSVTPRGKVIIRVCLGTACHIRGAPLLVDEFTRHLGIKSGETTADLGFTLETVNCVGACAMAPVVITGQRYHGNLSPAGVTGVIGDQPSPPPSTTAATAQDQTDDR